MANWNELRELSRGRLIAKYTEAEANYYHTYVGTLDNEDEEAYLADILEKAPLIAGQSVLDVGAGSGTMAKLISRVPELSVTAMEPSHAMCDLMRKSTLLSAVKIVEGECDCLSKRSLFPKSSFDVVISRQVVNSLYDPFMAFENWLYWLKPGGLAIVIDGIYGRDGWKGDFEEEIDVLPLSTCQSMATIPYLLESKGFCVESVGWMIRANLLPKTRTKRYVVVAKKPMAKDERTMS